MIKKQSQAMMNLTGSCPNIASLEAEESLCPIPQQKENLALLKKNSWKWLSLPYHCRSPLSGRRFSWNSLSGKNRHKRPALPQVSGEQHPLLATSRARARALSTSTCSVNNVDEIDGTTCSSVEDSFALIKHQLANLSEQDRYFSQRLHNLDKAIQDVRLIAYGQYSGDDCNNKNGARRVCINPQPQQATFNPPDVKSQSETCIIVISSDSEVVVDDDEVFSS